jgi:hypothetical protein
MDPRVKTPAAGLALQSALSQRLVTAMRHDSTALADVRALRTRLAAVKADSLERGFARLGRELASVYGIIQGSDQSPTTQALRAVADLERSLAAHSAQWGALRREARRVVP